MTHVYVVLRSYDDCSASCTVFSNLQAAKDHLKSRLENEDDLGDFLEDTIDEVRQILEQMPTNLESISLSDGGWISMSREEVLDHD